jgi:hypothetical protein
LQLFPPLISPLLKERRRPKGSMVQRARPRAEVFLGGNVSDLTTLKAVVEAARELNLPVLVGAMRKT